MVAHIGIEDVVGANHEAVFRECEFPTNFQHGSRSDVTGGRLFVTIYEVLRKREVAVGGGLQVIPDVAQFSVELEWGNLRHVAPVTVAENAAHVARRRGGTEAQLCHCLYRGARAKEQGLVAPHLVYGQEL